MCDTTMVGTHHCTFVETHRTHNTESDPQHKLWDLGDVTRHPLVGVSIMGRLCVWWGMYGNSVIFLSILLRT